MWIEKLQLKNFGKFHDKTIEFEPGLNIIYGGNESGKTTVHSFIVGMLFGIEKGRGRAAKDGLYSSYEPWNSASYYVGNMIMNIDGKRFFLERNFYHKEKTAKLRNMDDNEELSVEFGDLHMLLGGMTRENYQNTYCIRQAGFLADETLAGALESYMADVTGSGSGSVRLQAAEEELAAKKKLAERERKKSEAERETKSEKLAMEAVILKKDLAMQKAAHPEIEAEMQTGQEAEPEQNDLQEQQSDQAKSQIRYGLITGLLLFVFGILGMIAGGKLRAVGIVLMLSAVVIAYLGGMRRADAKTENEEVELPKELAESLEKIKEQWREKENRYFNLEEQLLELAEPSAREKELAEDERAYEMALEVMKKTAAQIYEEVSDELHESVSRNISCITDQKYDSIILDENLHLFIWENGKKIPVSQLSRGTLEQAYLAMRMAVGGILTREEEMPVLLDETFSMYDDDRLAQTLHWLSGYPGQILLFTCQKLEMELLDEMGIACHKIRLEEA